MKNLKLTKTDGSSIDVNFDLILSKEAKALYFTDKSGDEEIANELNRRHNYLDPEYSITRSLFDPHVMLASRRHRNISLMDEPTLAGTFLRAGVGFIQSHVRRTSAGFPYSYTDTRRYSEWENVTLSVLQSPEEIDEALKKGKRDLHADFKRFSDTKHDRKAAILVKAEDAIRDLEAKEVAAASVRKHWYSFLGT